MRSKNFLKGDNIQGLLMIAPNTIGLFLFYILPISCSIFLGLFRWDGLTAPKWTGIGNYLLLLNDKIFLSSLKNTLVYTVSVVPIIVVLVVIFGVLLIGKSEKSYNKIRLLYLLPIMTVPAAASLIWKWMLNYQFGLINTALNKFGIPSVSWLSDPDFLLVSVMLIGIWLGFAFNLIIVISGLKSIPAFYYEAAEIDGASSFKRFIFITLPLLTPTLFFVVVTQLIACFQVFDSAFVILGPEPPGYLREAASTLVISIYENGFKYFKMGYSSAQAFVLFVLVLIITGIQFKTQKKWVHYE